MTITNNDDDALRYDDDDFLAMTMRYDDYDYDYDYDYNGSRFASRCSFL